MITRFKKLRFLLFAHLSLAMSHPLPVLWLWINSLSPAALGLCPGVFLSQKSHPFGLSFHPPGLAAVSTMTLTKPSVSPSLKVLSSHFHLCSSIHKLYSTSCQQWHFSLESPHQSENNLWKAKPMTSFYIPLC